MSATAQRITATRDRASRVLLPDFIAIGQQALLNLALKGATVLDHGVDVTAVLVSDADNINAAYDAAVSRYRNATSIETPEERKDRASDPHRQPKRNA